MELKEVFEPFLNFVKNFQKKDREVASKQAAKDRLKLVLMQDRASVSPDFFEMMKQEIIDVIKKYIEIDEESLEVELTRGMEAGLEGPALYANIPIKNVKPVAPKNGEEEGENSDIMTEEKADAIAEQLLDQAEEILNKVNFENGSNKVIKNEQVEQENSNINNGNIKEDDDTTKAGNNQSVVDNDVKDISNDTENNKEEKKTDVKKDSKTTKTSKKSASKTTTKKPTNSKAKK